MAKTVWNKCLAWARSPIGKNVIQYGAAILIMGVLTLLVYFLPIPNPSVLLIAGLIVITALFGYAPGLLALIEMTIYSFWFYSTDHAFFRFDTPGITQLSVALFSGITMYVFVGELSRRHNKLTHDLEEANNSLLKDNRALKVASYTDALTGVNNRLAYRKKFPSYLGRPIFLAMIDIDDFKAANDKYGHGTGDHILRKVGRAITGAFGAENCYRYGGDEFLIVIETDETQFMEDLTHAESFISSLSDDYAYRQITSSTGFVFGTPESEEDLRLMLAEADHYLYQAKQYGKACHIGGPYDRAFALAINEKAHSQHYDPND